MDLKYLNIDTSQLSFTQGVGLVVATYFLYCIFYGLFLCPTRHLPGPFLTCFTGIPFAINLTSGEVSKRIHRQHEIYGTLHICVVTNLKVPSFDLPRKRSTFSSLRPLKMPGLVTMLRKLRGTRSIPFMPASVGDSRSTMLSP